MKYMHDRYDHVYYLDEGIYNSTLKQYTRGAMVTSITLNKQQLAHFKKMLADGGWNESARR
jgi:hypothetical protein